MFRFVAMVAIIFGSSVAWADTQDASAADREKMQGDWMVASMKTGGMDVAADEAQSLFRSIEGDRFKVSRYTKLIGQGTFRIDATQTPKTIDSTPAAAAGPAGETAKPIRGIYEFDGDKLRICNARPGQPRPKNFDAKIYTGQTLIVWEREMK